MTKSRVLCGALPAGHMGLDRELRMRVLDAMEDLGVKTSSECAREIRALLIMESFQVGYDPILFWTLYAYDAQLRSRVRKGLFYGRRD